MATLSNPTYYKNGVEDTSKLVGHDGVNNYVVRYTLTTESSESASRIYVLIDSGEYIALGSNAYNNWFWQELNENVSLYFKIGTDPYEFSNAGFKQISEATGKVTMVHTAGDSVEQNMKYNAQFEADVILLPSCTYYVWIFPGFAPGGSPNGNYRHLYFGWYDRGDNGFVYTVDLSGIAGAIYISNGTTFDAYIPYIDNGTSWDVCIPYIDNGTSWDVCT